MAFKEEEETVPLSWSSKQLGSVLADLKLDDVEQTIDYIRVARLRTWDSTTTRYANYLNDIEMAFMLASFIDDK